MSSTSRKRALIRVSSFAARMASRRSLSSVSFGRRADAGRLGAPGAATGSPPESCSTIVPCGLDDEGRAVGHLRPAAERGDRQADEQAEEEDVDEEPPQAVEAAEEPDEQGRSVFAHGVSYSVEKGGGGGAVAVAPRGADGEEGVEPRDAPPPSG